ncbi:MAG: DNA-directed RNA polymerase subunit alpha C-terminal domain-containing protein [Ferruginibacter sp.]
MKEKNKSVELLFNLSAPAKRALERQGIKTLNQLSGYSEKDILDLHGVGAGSIPKLREALEEKGLSFARKDTLKKTTSKTLKTDLEVYIKYHNDGSVWGKGQTLNGQPHGYFEWYRKGGVIMRSGHFDNGKQVGNWTTYDKTGKVYKVTKMKA